MTYKIKLSDMKKFEITDAKIQDFAREVKTHLNRQEMIEKTKDHPDPSERWAHCPAPQAHPIIMNAVDKDGNVKYEIDDDTKEESAVTLEQKRAILFIAVQDKENFERNKILPDAKVRLIGLHQNRIATADNVMRMKLISDPNRLVPEKIEEEVKKARSSSDQEFLDQLEKIKTAKEAIEWWAAEQHSEIADLTIDNIDTWKSSPLKV